MSLVRNITEFTCKVCGMPIGFNVSDESTYLSKTEHEDFFGMTLTTYRVSHDTATERHYNSVVVDNKGLFRGYRDAYSESLQKVDSATEQRYWVYHEDDSSADPTNGIELALLISRDQRWVIDIVCPSSMNASEIATLVVDKVEEAYRVYKTIPQPMETHLANLDFYIWTSEKRILCAVLKNPTLISTLSTFATRIIEEVESEVIPRRRLLNLVFHIIEKNPNLPASMFTRLMNEDMLFTKFQTPYEDRIPSIVERTATRFPIARDILGPILRGYMTLIEALETKGYSQYQEIFDMIDFINRRRLLG